MGSTSVRCSSTPTAWPVSRKSVAPLRSCGRRASRLRRASDTLDRCFRGRLLHKPRRAHWRVLRVGSKRPKVRRSAVARPAGLDAPSPFGRRHSERGLGFRRRLCATASCGSESPTKTRPDASFSSVAEASDDSAETTPFGRKQQAETFRLSLEQRWRRVF
jgi:hypothetical protein